MSDSDVRAASGIPPARPRETAVVRGSRREGREAALQAVYMHDVCGENPAELPEPAWSQEPLTPKARTFARHLAEGVAGTRERIDKLLKKYAENWDLARMAAIDRCILRIGTYEILHDLDTPISVVINEAVEIAKRYSTAESSRFVNGILDKIQGERGA
ncbi:MAG TPA: transcription antitermination factor NusB [Elusimicrobiota bacterium]|nr:transcription antitermination factor NusB [Elusimicrobiota bacterium]